MEKRNIRLIGLDLDGTLLDSQKHFTEYSKSVLTEAIRRGVVILPATGRPVTGIPKEVMYLPGVRYALTANGARLLDVQEDRILHEQLLPYEKAKALLDIFRRYDSYMDIYYDGVGYADREKLKHMEHYIENEPARRYMETTRHPVDDVYEMLCTKKKPVDKVQAMFASREDQLKAWDLIRDTVQDVELATSVFNNIEINGKNATKGNALLKLGELLGIPREEIMACGDGLNDLDMIRKAGLGVAMANGVKQVREAADYVTVSNDEDGAARAIERFVL